MNTFRQELKDIENERNIIVNEIDLEEAKQVFGDVATTLPEEDFKNTLTDIHFLAETWLDEFEKNIFNGKTLEELLESEKYP